MMDVIREIEHQLVQVLIDNVPGAEARETMQRKAEDQWKTRTRVAMKTFSMGRR